MKSGRVRDISRRALLCQTAIASGLGAIFRASAPAQQGGGRGAPVRYGPINKFSAPSDLKITDIRALRIAANFDYPIIKIFTNQDVYGLGEVRDAGNENSALAMRPLLVGRNPLDISGILQSVRPYAGAGVWANALEDPRYVEGVPADQQRPHGEGRVLIAGVAHFPQPVHILIGEDLDDRVVEIGRNAERPYVRDLQIAGSGEFEDHGH